MILIDSIYICQSGGKTLVDLLIAQFEIESSIEEIVFIIDSRLEYFYRDRNFKQIKIEYCKGSEFSRYCFYSKNKKSLRKVLCFANVPPPIKLDCEVITYFQNIILLDRDVQKCFPLNNRILFLLKGYIIKKRLNKTDTWLVQTEHVKELLVKYLNINVEKIGILPFFNNETFANQVGLDQKENAFFYPATAASHKNHNRLIQVWKNLHRESKINYYLHLTIDKDSSSILYCKINKLQLEGVPIINHGYLSKSEVDKLYSKCRFVIHPSLGESFGLVLIEALKNNCILLAPDLPYVKALVKPNYFFNANETDAIEKSVLQSIFGENCLNSEILITSEINKLVQYVKK